MKASDFYMRDPFVLYDDGIYYLIGTTDKHWGGGLSDGFKIYTSKDLKRFDGPHTVFKPNEFFWSKECWWAPELHKYNGKYYIFATFWHKNHKRACDILVSDTALGPYRSFTEKPLTPENWDCLDGTLYVENNIPYLIYCREWSGMTNGNGEIYSQQLSNDLSHLTGEKRKMFDAKSVNWTVGIRHDPTDCKEDYITDGPFMWRMKNNDLIMIWSSFSENGYAVGVAKSDNGSILGNFIHQDKPVFSADGGHGMLFTSPKGQIYLTIHVNNASQGKEHAVFYPVNEVNNTIEVV